MTGQDPQWTDEATRKEAVRRLRAHAKKASASVETFLRWSYEIELARHSRGAEKVLNEASDRPLGKGSNPNLLEVAREILSLDPENLDRINKRRKWLDKQETRREARYNLRKAILHTLDTEGEDAVKETLAEVLRGREVGERIRQKILSREANGGAGAAACNVIQFSSG